MFVVLCDIEDPRAGFLELNRHMKNNQKDAKKMQIILFIGTVLSLGKQSYKKKRKANKKKQISGRLKQRKKGL